MLHPAHKIETELYDVLNEVDPKLTEKYHWLLDTIENGDYDEGEYDDGEPPPGGFATYMTRVVDDEDYDDLLVAILPATRLRVPVENVRDLDDLSEDRTGPTGFAAPRNPWSNWGNW